MLLGPWQRVCVEEFYYVCNRKSKVVNNVWKGEQMLGKVRENGMRRVKILNFSLLR